MSCTTWGLPCRSGYPEARWALTPPFHPYLCPCGPSAVYSLLHCPSKRLAAPVPHFREARCPLVSGLSSTSACAETATVRGAAAAHCSLANPFPRKSLQDRAFRNPPIPSPNSPSHRRCTYAAESGSGSPLKKHPARLRSSPPEQPRDRIIFHISNMKFCSRGPEVSSQDLVFLPQGWAWQGL